MDLFDQQLSPQELPREPLASRMRPRTLGEFVGQRHILGKGRLLRRAIQADQLSSLIFFGPPGSGKTTLARIIANTTKAEFHSINAVMAGVKDIREAIKRAEDMRTRYGKKYILFIDEVHRFNKAQQDALLYHVENGTLILIGATTENPYFEVNKALISRSRIFQLYALEDEDLLELARAALADIERGYGNLNVRIDYEALDHLIKVAHGDARAVLNALELAVETTEEETGETLHIRLQDAEESIQRKAVLYDRDGDAHYDTISAFIKSVRGSDPDAALYWLAKMVYAGEDPRFIFRRMLILASEDIGMADPNALRVIVSAARAYDYVGLPEGRYHLAQACLYLATAPKSNSALAFFDALKEMEKSEKGEIPNHLKDSSRDKDGFGHGKGYLYPHAYRDHWVAQQYLPGSLQGKVFYKPSLEGYEKSLMEEVNSRRDLQFAALLDSGNSLGESTGTSKLESGDFWLQRSLGSTAEILKQVRTEVFSLMGLEPENMVLDLSGGMGFLTWEACARCSRGGVWSCCKNGTELKRMKDWVEHFKFMLRPNLFEMSWDSWDPKFFKEEDEWIEFDAITGYNLFAGEEAGKALDKIEFLFDSCLAKKGNLVLSQIDNKNSQSFCGLLSFCLEHSGSFGKREQQLLETIDSIETEHREDTELKFKSVIETGINTWGDSGKNKSFQKSFSVTRRLGLEQLRGWFLKAEQEQSGSVLHTLRKALPDEDWSRGRRILEHGLPGKDIPWKQSYHFWKITK